MIANPSFHCWRDAQGLMNPTEVVVHVMERNCAFQVLKLFAESIRQSRESPHRHSHCEVLPLDVARGNVVVVGITADNRFARPHADGGTVTCFWRFVHRAVNLLQHRIINLGTEGIFNRVKVCAMAVCCKLNAVRKTLLQVVHEVICTARVAVSDEPAGNELRIGVKGNPRPNVACSGIMVVS